MKGGDIWMKGAVTQICMKPPNRTSEFGGKFVCGWRWVVLKANLVLADITILLLPYAGLVIADQLFVMSFYKMAWVQSVILY